MTDHTFTAAQTVSMTWPKALNVTRHADNSWHGDISFARFPTDEELKALHEFLRVNHAGSAQPPAAPVETDESKAWADVASLSRSSADNGGDILERLLFMADVGLSGFHDPAIIGELRSATDEIKRLRAVPQEVSVWQPIETAPKDGTPVLLGFPDYLHAMHGHCEDGIWGQLDSDFGFEHLPTQPTHWMPLPSSPMTRPEGK